MIKAVIYDADGMVLRGSRFSDTYAKEFGIPLEDMASFFTGVFGKCIEGKADLKEELLRGGWLEKWHWHGTIDELLAYWFRCGNTVDDAIADSIRKLRATGMVCLLATNQEKYRTQYFRKALGFSECFNAMFVSSEIGCKKSEPRFILQIMQYLHAKDPSINENEVFFWDDRESNVEEVKAYGMQAQLYREREDYLTWYQLVSAQ